MSHPTTAGYGAGPVVQIAPGSYKRPIDPGPEWTDRAMGWPVKIVSRETDPGHWLTDVVPIEPKPPLQQWHLVCTLCEGEPSVFCLSPDLLGQSYVTSGAELVAGILGHLRRSHDPGVASQ